MSLSVTFWKIKLSSIVKMTQITYPTLFLITYLYLIDTRWIESLPRLHHGLIQGLTGGGQIGFSDWWQMAVLTQAEEMFCCWKYKVTNSEATLKSVPRGMLRITVSAAMLKPSRSRSWLLWSTAVCARRVCAACCHVGSLFTCCRDFREGVCLCVRASCEISPRINEYT